MGNQNSNLKLTASVTVQGKCCPVDGITLSYVRRRSCCGRRRRLLAAFTFPRHGWRQVSSEDTRRNISSKAAVVPLDHLRKKDGDTAVQVICLSGGVPVYRSEVTLTDLLQRLDLTTRGKEAKVFFSLSGGKTEEGNTEAHTFTALFCNGRRCGDGGAATPADTPHRRRREAEDGLRKAAISSGHEEDGQGQIHSYDGSGNESSGEKASLEPDPVHQVAEDRLAPSTEDAIFEAFDAANNSDWACEDDEKEEDMVHDDDGMEEEKQDEVIESPPIHSGDYRTPTCLQGWRGSSVMDSLGYIAGVAAVMLVWYNAWQEYSSY